MNDSQQNAVAQTGLVYKFYAKVYVLGNLADVLTNRRIAAKETTFNLLGPLPPLLAVKSNAMTRYVTRSKLA